MKLNSIRTTILAAALSCAFLPTMASAGIFDDDEARKAILDLRAKVDAVNARLDSRLETKADKGTALELANENEALRAEISKLRGQIEVLTNDLTNAQKRQQDFYIDLDNRIRKLEPKRVTVDGQDATVDVNEQRTYDAAGTLFKAGDYKAATPALSNFLMNYPQSAYAGTVQYWLGLAYFMQRDYRNAIANMQLVVKSYPDHPKVPDALLNIAACHIELKEKPAAKKVLESVLAKYPDTEAAQAAKNRLAGLK
ncbi:tol-pal system protein YbgF [Undibacterium sp. TC4M20W]|uniref:tol-pal system protein YbgF n=1 Tax=unclassified Undibacterium TaxID=2630295 RepID=UPI003BF45111